MSNLDTDFDTQMVNLEYEWREVYEASIIARADYQLLAASNGSNVKLLDTAREKLERADARKARIMAKIERLESSMLRRN